MVNYQLKYYKYKTKFLKLKYSLKYFNGGNNQDQLDNLGECKVGYQVMSPDIIGKYKKEGSNDKTNWCLKDGMQF